MTSRPWRFASALAVAAVVATEAADRAAGERPIHPAEPFEDRALVERGVFLVRLDPKRAAPSGACETLSARDLVVTIGGAEVKVTSVERVPRPERHWLLLDVSESAESRRSAAKRSAQQYVREVMAKGEDAATLVTIDDDVVLAAGPSTDPAFLAARIDEIPAGGMSALRDGLDTVLRQVEGDRHEQLIVYWTDGEDTTSIGSLDELLATIDRTPHATVFPVLLLSNRGSEVLRAPAGTFLFEMARRSGGEVLGSWDPRWLDRVRGWIARRFAVSVAYPVGTPAGRVSVALRDRSCTVTPLRDPFARPDPVAGAAAPAPFAWVRLHGRQKGTDDPVCVSGADSPSWEWPWRDEGSALTGCLLDVTRSPLRFGARSARVLAPAVSALPTSLVDAIDAFLPKGEGPSPLLVSGSALLAQRARIAASLFAERRDYRDFAVARLAELAHDELRAIERGFARDFPDLPSDAIAAAALASRAGRRAHDAAKNPTDADLSNVLTAWLSDIPARSLFSQWEYRLIDARIASGRVSSSFAEWEGLHDRLTSTNGPRIVAPLILIKDPARRVIGFSRIECPQRLGKSASDVDAIPQRPLALLLVDRIASLRGVSKCLSAGGYRATGIKVESSVPAWRVGVGDPFRRARVTVVLESSTAAARAVLEAELATRDDGTTTIASFVSSVTGDPQLAALLHQPRLSK